MKDQKALCPEELASLVQSVNRVKPHNGVWTTEEQTFYVPARCFGPALISASLFPALTSLDSLWYIALLRVFVNIVRQFEMFL